GIKFQCPACAAEGHDQHRDNACFFNNGNWGCAYTDDRGHWDAIGRTLGVLSDGSVPHATATAEAEPTTLAPEAPYRFAPAFPPNHFVSRFVAYGAQCVDSAHDYFETVALVALAVATPGLRAKLRQYPRGLGTAFYAILIGDSTRSRKSTA